ncbi:MAG UNVERIFIED_CONTAM: hypothetical protein LVR29_21970 [Microcystis novacekii LVE1205-3]|jgi:type I restriction enzyme R subunit
MVFPMHLTSALPALRIIKEEKELTKNVFGGCVSVYDFKRAIEDRRATLPLRYVNKGEKLGLKNPKMDEEMIGILEQEGIGGGTE